MNESLRALSEAATPGPWVHSTDIGQIGSIETQHGTVVAQAQSLICDDVRKQRDNNSKYIAAANPSAILALLDRVKALEECLNSMFAQFKNVPEEGMIGFDNPPEPTTQWDYDAFQILGQARALLENKS